MKWRLWQREIDASQYQSARTRGNSLMSSKIASILGTFALLIAAPLFALFLTAHVFQPYEVDGSSMETSLQNGDRLIVYKLPKTMANLSDSHIKLQRLDILVFDRPQELSAARDTTHLIKRVIGLPGDRVVIDDGLVTIYNNENPDGFNPDEGQDYAKDIITTPGKVDITVGLHEYYVLGDNRTNSSDSRVFGSVSDKLIVGRAYIRFIPVDNMKRL